ncbi:MAG: prepilin-type N-terminal cleavage/methylation domain-containing protein [Candidatus Omnitrophica bacterium]|nr:prepilin-type N-terminal cleavage/methylation domain-containing protein [Candidatus Omnitrophota bacterium]
MRNKKGFTMVELLVVLVIVAILAAVATPIYLANVKRSRASEAVSTMGLVRQALRDYQVNASTYFDIASPNILGTLPTLVLPATGAPTPPASGVDVDAATARYFSNAAFSVDALGTAAPGAGASGMFAGPPIVDFLISVDGGASIPCDPNFPLLVDCATRQTEVGGTVGEEYLLEMDNSGRVFVSYDNGGTWASY